MVERSSNRETALLQDALDALSAKLTDGIKTEMDGVRAEVKGLAGELGNLRIDVAVQHSELKTMQASIEANRSEGNGRAKEIGAFGITMTGFTNRLDNLDRAIAKLEPAVGNLQSGRVLDEGKVKGVGMAWEGGSKVVAVLAGLGGLIVVVAGWLSWLWTSTGGRHPGGGQ